jgi:hypothetical protein
MTTRGAIRPEVLEDLARRLRHLGQREAAAERRRVAQQLGVSDDRLRRLVKAHADGPLRSPRAVRPKRRKLQADQVQALGRLLAQTVNNRDRVGMPVVDLVEVAKEAGVIPDDVSTSTVSRALRAAGMDKARLEGPKPSVRRRSRHPNHVHQVDWSHCRQWDLGGDAELLPHRARRYKPGHFGGRVHLWRLMLTDHASGAFYVRYYASPGEGPDDLIDFLHRAWSREGKAAGLVLAGLPDVVLADAGAAFKATQIRNLLSTLDVQLEEHGAGNARASGSVEKAHDLWEERFESRLTFNPAGDLAELNRQAEATAGHINANEDFSRLGAPRNSALRRVPRLRLPPDWETFCRLAHRTPMTRRVNNYNSIQIDKRQYELRGAIAPGDQVTVTEYPYCDARFRAHNQQGEELTIVPLTQDEYGFWRGGTEGGFAGEQYARHPETPAERVLRLAESDPIAIEDAFGTPPAPATDVLLPRPEPALPAASLPPAPPVDAEDVVDLAMERLARRLRPHEYDRIQARVGDGIPADRVDALLLELFAELQPPPAASAFVSTTTHEEIA